MVHSGDIDSAAVGVTDPSWIWRRKMAHQGTNSKTLTRADVPIVNLKGNWVIISGANSGIGREAALFFAECGANVILACRNPPPTEAHPNAVVSECQARAQEAGHKSATFEWWEINMADLSTVEAFAKRWLATSRPLDILCNNAGTGAPPGDGVVYKTKDGFEFVHQVNFLSHVLLTSHLLPSLAKAKAPRVVCTTSCMTYYGDYNLSNMNGEGCLRQHLYSNNKLYYQMWLVELQRRMLQTANLRHITINGVHPGYVDSGIWNFADRTSPDRAIQRAVLGTLKSWFSINPEQGSYAITHAATSLECGPDPETQGVGEKGGLGGGRYFNRIWEAEQMPHVQSTKARAKLWEKVVDELDLEKKGLLKILEW